MQRAMERRTGQPATSQGCWKELPRDWELQLAKKPSPETRTNLQKKHGGGKSYV